jgi:serine protease Do
MESIVSTANRKSLVVGAAFGAMAAVLIGAGGYWAHASAAPGGAVNVPVAAPPIAGGAPASFADIVARVAPAVVSIDVEGKADPRQIFFPGSGSGSGGGRDGDDEGGGGSPFGFDFRQLIPRNPRGDGGELPRTQATGSGFFISSDGYIVTNNHVVDGAEKITVRTTDDRELKARVIGRDEATDLAVIKVEGGSFPFVSFEDRAKPRVGDWVVAVGNPFNLGGSATAGIVSALGRPNVSGSSFVDFMQIDAPINRGNSGGPTFDMYGRVVGVNTAIFSPSGGSVGIGFDIPADVAASVTKQLMSGGKVVRGYIGASIQSVTPEIADSLGLGSRKGALVAEITPGGPAEQAGLKSGDLILQVNGHEVSSGADLTRQVALAHAGEVIRLQVRRDGQMRELAVHSGVRPSEASLARNDRPDPNAPDAQSDAQKVLGMRLSPNPEGGVSIQGVSNASDAGQKGLRAGDVIVRAGDHKATTPADVSAAAAEAKKAGKSSVLLMVERGGRRTFIPLKVDGEG